MEKAHIKKVEQLIGKASFSRGRAIALGTSAMVASQWTQALGQTSKFEIKCACSLPADHPISVRAVQMWSAVRRESGGRLQVSFFPNSTLGGDSAMLSQVRSAAIQMMFVAPANLAPVVPAIDIANLGFAFKDSDEALGVMDGALGEHLHGEIAAKGLYGFRSFYDGGMFQVGSATHPIATPEDLRGFKIRVAAGKILTDLFKELGASPAPISASEMYLAQSTKLVDGCNLPLIAFTSWRMYEVSKYVSMTNHSWSGVGLIANGDFWKSLPAELQGILERNNTKFARLERRDAKELLASLTEKLPRLGMVFNRPDQAPFKKMLGPYREYWAGVFGPTAWKALESGLRRS